MNKAKIVEYKNGMKFSCGPPAKAGAYTKWNWCRLCESIFDKSMIKCTDCNHKLRAKARSNYNHRSVPRSIRLENRMKMLEDMKS